MRRVREAPAERRVVQRAVAARERLLGLRDHERRAGHRLDAARDEQVAVAGDRPRGTRRRRPRDRTRRAGSRSRRRPTPAARRAARPCARRCGCPRPPGSRSRSRRPRSRSAGDAGARRPPRAIASAARSSGRTPGERAAVAPDRRAHTGEDDRAAHSTHSNLNAGVRPLEQLAHRLPALVAVVVRQLVHVHVDEAVAARVVEAAAEAERVLERLVAVLERGVDRRAQDRGDLAHRGGAEVASTCSRRAAAATRSRAATTRRDRGTSRGRRRRT